MDNQDILDRIQALVDEEHLLRASVPLESEDPDAAYEERKIRLRRVEEDLDQCWELLRRRRAKENAGSDPDQALARAADEVEG